MTFAFLFPGQGSQSVGMMQNFGDLAVVRDTFAEASSVLGTDFWQMVTEPNEALNQTAHTQPLMLTAGIAVWRAWQQAGHALPTAMAGHSLGEYSALVAAEAIRFVDALLLVRYRAELMQDAVAEGAGAMAAVLGLDDAVVRTLCAEAARDEVLEAVNFNSPGQVVIAGNRSAVERGIELARERGAKRALVLPVSVPSHCALMKPAAEKLQAYLQNVEVRVPRMSVLHNVDVMAHRDAESIRMALVQQLYSPVLWVDTVRTLAAAGATHMAECGPGKVLSGLNKRIVPEVPCLALTGTEAMAEAAIQLL